MKNITYSLLFLITAFCTSCNHSSTQQNNKSSIDSSNYKISSIKDSLSTKPDTTLKNESKITEFKSVDDYIINKKDKSNKALRSNIKYEIEQWKNVSNPFVASYQGCDFGDYFHLNFKDANSKNYDFGFGNNNYGEYSLFDTLSFKDNHKYLKHSFKIYWDWKPTSFPCCDGEYNLVKAYLPSITKLELLENKGSKK